MKDFLLLPVRVALVLASMVFAIGLLLVMGVFATVEYLVSPVGNDKQQGGNK